jgi:hypothetical protein
MKTEYFVEYSEIDMFSEPHSDDKWHRVPISFETLLDAQDARHFMAVSKLVKDLRIAEVKTITTTETNYLP